MNTREINIWVITISVVVILWIVFLASVSANKTGPLPPMKVNNSTEMRVLERGVIDGSSYVIFLHAPTGKKIFAYNHAMIYLPVEPIENNTK